MCLGGNLVAQTGIITGKISDNTTGLPLIGANIILVNTDFGTASDLEGFFEIEVPEGKYVMTSSMIGYAQGSTVVIVQDNQDIAVTQALNPIVLESKKFVTVHGVKSDELMLAHFQETNISTTENLISRIEGVNLISRGNYAQEPIIRGMSGGQLNITIDGMKSFGACTDRMDPISSYVEADALNSVEIGKGATSIENGSTVGGALNLTFQKPEYARIEHSSWYLKGAFNSGSNERKLSFLNQKKRPRSAWSLSGAYRKAGDYVAANRQTIPFSGFEKLNLNFGYLKRLDSENQLHLEIISDDAYDIGYASLPMDVGYARMRMIGLSLHSTGLAPNILNMEWKVYGNAIDHWMDDSKRVDLFMDMHMDMPGFTRTVGTFLNFVFAQRNRSILKLRSDAYWNSSYADMVMYPVNSSPMKMVTWPGVERFSWGQFAQYQSQISSRININLSARYDFLHTLATDEMGKNALQIYYPENDFKRQDHLVSANGFLTYKINPTWQSVFKLARGSRIPTVSEAFGYYLYNPIDGYLYLGNPEIPNEKSTQIEWQNVYSADQTRVEVSLYHYELDNYIFGQVTSQETLGYANGWKRYVDAGRCTIAGVETTILHHFSPHWSLQGGFNYEQGRLLEFDDNLPLIPPLEVHGSIRFNTSEVWFQIDVKASGEQHDYSALSGENSTSSYGLLSLKGEYSAFPGLTINSGIDNVTNQLYHDHLDWGDIYRPGRNAYISLTIDETLF